MIARILRGPHFGYFCIRSANSVVTWKPKAAYVVRAWHERTERFGRSGVERWTEDRGLRVKGFAPGINANPTSGLALASGAPEWPGGQRHVSRRPQRHAGAGGATDRRRAAQSAALPGVDRPTG